MFAMFAKRISVAVAVLVIATTGLTACGDADAPEAQPVEDAAVFDEGMFGDLPLFPKSEPLGRVARTDDTVSRSYRASMATPAKVLEFYEDSLVDWEVIEAPKQIGAGSTMRGIWRDGDLELTISATEGPTVPEEGEDLGDAGAVVSQYSLSLRDRG